MTWGVYIFVQYIIISLNTRVKLLCHMYFVRMGDDPSNFVQNICCLKIIFIDCLKTNITINCYYYTIIIMLVIPRSQFGVMYFVLIIICDLYSICTCIKEPHWFSMEVPAKWQTLLKTTILYATYCRLEYILLCVHKYVNNKTSEKHNILLCLKYLYNTCSGLYMYMYMDIMYVLL